MIVDNMKRTGFNGYVYDFSVNYDAIAVNDIKNINRYLMKKNNIVWCLKATYKKYLDLLKKYFEQGQRFYQV